MAQNGPTRVEYDTVVVQADLGDLAVDMQLEIGFVHLCVEIKDMMRYE